ncbi:response regulator [uncultured Gemmiger sp.]|uniref:response regulator transcription factor n=1 Tax=uncultured Gemmiger sp. TaxID=1623490 RepID=UPI0025F18521|nr:response regulator [uncultured Gemmiger sp.]
MYKILVVDDESIEREGISFLIEKYKFPLEVAQATNGKTALEYMRTHPIDILLTDVKMPQMDGLELARHTFEKYPDVRILVFSAYGEFEFAKKAMAAQAVSYLLKPIEVDEFQRVMTQIIAQCDELSEKKKDEQQRDEEVRQQLLFRLVTGTGLGKARITDDLFPGQTLCLLHVQTESDYFATSEETFCDILKDCTPCSFEYINTYPDESFVLFYGSRAISDRLTGRMNEIQEKLHQSGCEASLLLGVDFTGAENISARAQALTKIRSELYEAPTAILLEKDVSESVSYYAEVIEKHRAEVQAALADHRPDVFLPAAQRLIQQLGQNRALSRMYMYHVLYDLLAQMYRAYGVQDTNAIGQGISRILSCNTAAAMCGVLEEIVTALQGAPEPQAADSSAVIRQVQKIVDAEYGQPLSLEYIAEKVYITPSYLSYIFKQMTGQNLIKYITDLRMYKARRMVADGNLKISQIAKNCGYDNPSYFNKIFKNYFGVTPRQYREGERDESIV